MWDYFFNPNPNNPPQTKSLPLQAQLSSHRKIKCSIEIQLFTAWEGGTPYVKYQLQSVTPLHRVRGGMSITKEHHCQICSIEIQLFTTWEDDTPYVKY